MTKLPEMLDDAQVARWQGKYGRDPTDQQRSWLVNKIRTDIATIGTKLNAQVTRPGPIKNIQNMHAKSLPPTGARGRMELEYQDWARLQGRGPHTGGPKGRLVGWRMCWSLGTDNDSPADSLATLTDRLSSIYY